MGDTGRCQYDGNAHKAFERCVTNSRYVMGLYEGVSTDDDE